MLSRTSCISLPARDSSSLVRRQLLNTNAPLFFVQSATADRTGVVEICSTNFSGRPHWFPTFGQTPLKFGGRNLFPRSGPCQLKDRLLAHTFRIICRTLQVAASPGDYLFCPTVKSLPVRGRNLPAISGQVPVGQNCPIFPGGSSAAFSPDTGSGWTCCDNGLLLPGRRNRRGNSLSKPLRVKKAKSLSADGANAVQSRRELPEITGPQLCETKSAVRQAAWAYPRQLKTLDGMDGNRRSHRTRLTRTASKTALWSTGVARCRLTAPEL